VNPAGWELFRTYNAVYDSGRQLVLTCDRLPTQLLAIESIEAAA
jgi:chromosomal replication initiation ATPase DnaA